MQNKKTQEDLAFKALCEETTKIWLNRLIKDNGVSSVSELTSDMILEEIEGVKGSISNERLWAHADPIHFENIATLLEYERVLNELLYNKNKEEDNNA